MVGIFLWRRGYSSSEFYRFDFPGSIGSDCRRFYFLRFSGFLWAIDGPTNAAAIDSLIIVAVPGCLELVSFLGMVLDLNYKVFCFFCYFSFSFKVGAWV